jgi:transposase-like protein
MTPARPLWKCPDCGRVFANRNQTHACGRYDLAHHFRGRPPEIRRIYAAFRKAVEVMGPVRVMEHPRFRRIESISARNHVHRFRLASVDEVDRELRGWLREAYAVGEQKHLKPRARFQ